LENLHQILRYLHQKDVFLKHSIFHSFKDVFDFYGRQGSTSSLQEKEFLHDAKIIKKVEMHQTFIMKIFVSFEYKSNKFSLKFHLFGME